MAAKKKANDSAKTTGKTWSVEASQDAYAKFVALWNGAATKGEVISKSGLSVAKVSTWSYRLRAAGVPLKKFKTKPEMNVKELTEIAKKALKS